MQEGNILLRHDAVPPGTVDLTVEQCEQLSPSSLIIIDYEYCAYNYRSYDIANHFMEWTFDYQVPDFPYYSVLPEHYPTTEQQVSIWTCSCLYFKIFSINFLNFI